MGICTFITHYLEAMRYVQDLRVQLKLPRGLEKTVSIVCVSGLAFFDKSKRTPNGI